MREEGDVARMARISRIDYTQGERAPFSPKEGTCGNIKAGVSKLKKAASFRWLFNHVQKEPVGAAR